MPGIESLGRLSQSPGKACSRSCSSCPHRPNDGKPENRETKSQNLTSCHWPVRSTRASGGILPIRKKSHDAFFLLSVEPCQKICLSWYINLNRRWPKVKKRMQGSGFSTSEAYYRLAWRCCPGFAFVGFLEKCFALFCGHWMINVGYSRYRFSSVAILVARLGGYWIRSKGCFEPENH